MTNVEQWSGIPSCPSYEASSHGRIRRAKPYVSTRPGRVLKPQFSNSGYHTVAISEDGHVRRLYVHRLVCEAFHGPPPDKWFAGHLDGNRINNRSDNLRWVTQSENERHKREHGTYRCGEGHHATVLSDLDVQLIRAHVAFGAPIAQTAKLFGTSFSNAHRIVRAKSRLSAGGYLDERSVTG